MLSIPKSAARAASAAIATGALVGSAAPVLADLEVTRSGGILGEGVGYALDGDAFELYVLIPSVTTGPTPVSPFDPGDPRVLDVGLELFGIARIGFLDGSGSATENYPLNNDPTLVGIALYAQAATILGLPSTIDVDDISNRVGFVLAGHGDTTFTIGDRSAAYDGHTATTLDDGRVLFAGGSDSVVSRDALEVFDPQTQEFSVLPNTMTTVRVQAVATRLADGRVLITGGSDALGAVLTSAEIFDPVTDSSTAVASMGTGRVLHTATLLADGRVFVAGGAVGFDLADPLGSIGNVVASSEVYDPVADTWTPGPNFSNPRIGHGATLLPDGRVLVAGGLEVLSVFGADVPTITNDCRRYNPATNTYDSAASFSGVRALHGQVALDSGHVLIAGGADVDFLTLTAVPLASARRYNPTTNSWTNVADLASARGFNQLLNTGSEVLCVGGINSIDIATFAGTAEKLIEVTTDDGLTWGASGTLNYERLSTVPAIIDGGERVLVTGTGDNLMGTDDFTAELHHP